MPDRSCAGARRECPSPPMPQVLAAPAAWLATTRFRRAHRCPLPWHPVQRRRTARIACTEPNPAWASLYGSPVLRIAAAATKQPSMRQRAALPPRMAVVGGATSRDWGASRLGFHCKALPNLPDGVHECLPPKDGTRCNDRSTAGACIRTPVESRWNPISGCWTLFTAGEDSGSVYGLASPDGKDLRVRSQDKKKRPPGGNGGLEGGIGLRR